MPSCELPDVCWKAVFNHLDTRSLSRVNCVNHRFRRISSDHSLWRVLVFRGGKTRLFKRGVCLRGSNYCRAIRLAVPALSSLTKHACQKVEKYCPNVTTMSIYACTPYPHFGSITRLTLNVPGSVDSLTLSGYISCYGRWRFVRNLAQLEIHDVLRCCYSRLSISESQNFAHLQRITLTNCGYAWLDALCQPNIHQQWEAVTLSGICIYDHHVVAVLANCCKLRQLTLDDCPSLTPGCLDPSRVRCLERISGRNSAVEHTLPALAAALGKRYRDGIVFSLLSTPSVSIAP